VPASSSNGNESSAATDDAKRRRLKWFLCVGVVLIIGGVTWRIASLINAFSALSRNGLASNEKQDILTHGISSVEYGNYAIAIGALLVAGSAARLIVLAVARKKVAP
jgi:hypothetical protein